MIKTVCVFSLAEHNSKSVAREICCFCHQHKILDMAPNKQTYFSKSWLSGRSWLQEVEGNNKMAYCDLCLKFFTLGNMGEKAVKSHGNGKIHLQKQALQSTNSIEKFVKPTKNSNVPAQNVTPNPTPGNKVKYLKFSVS